MPIKPQDFVDPVLAPYIESFKQQLLDHGLEADPEALASLRVVKTYPHELADPTGVQGTDGRWYYSPSTAGYCRWLKGVDDQGATVLWSELQIMNSMLIPTTVLDGTYPTDDLPDPSWTFSWRLLALMYHELTHCLLLKSHADNGIMSPRGAGEPSREEGQALLDELFSPSYQDALPDLKIFPRK